MIRERFNWIALQLLKQCVRSAFYLRIHRRRLPCLLPFRFPCLRGPRSRPGRHLPGQGRVHRRTVPRTGAASFKQVCSMTFQSTYQGKRDKNCRYPAKCRQESSPMINLPAKFDIYSTNEWWETLETFQEFIAVSVTITCIFWRSFWSDLLASWADEKATSASPVGRPWLLYLDKISSTD